MLIVTKPLFYPSRLRAICFPLSIHLLTNNCIKGMMGKKGSLLYVYISPVQWNVNCVKNTYNMALDCAAYAFLSMYVRVNHYIRRVMKKKVHYYTLSISSEQ